MRLEGKVAVVTGAARGIGAACARRFAAEGADVVLADILEAERRGDGASDTRRRRPCRLHALRYRRRPAGPRADRADGLAPRAHRRLVNNAGIFTIADFLDVTEEDFDRVLRVNLKGYFLVGQAAAREMAAAGSGSIINMSSVNAVMAIDSIAPYVVSKGGVNQLTSVMALALAPKGVRVNADWPGHDPHRDVGVADHRQGGAATGPLPHTEWAASGSRRRSQASRSSTASEDSSYVTGQVIYADGKRMRLNYTMPVDGDG